MSGERQAALAVTATMEWLDAQLPGCLTAVETQRSMAAGTLTVPADVIGASLPEYGGATPLIEVFEDDAKQINPRQKHYIYLLHVICTHASDADIEGGRSFLRDYSTALVDCLSKDPSFGRGNFGTEITGLSFAASHGSNAKHLHHVAIDLLVEIFDT